MSEHVQPKRNRPSVTVRIGVPSLLGECETCGERWDERGQKASNAAMARAKLHARRTGHTVFVERMRGTYFNAR